MSKETFKQFIDFSQLLVIISFGYTGLLFAGRVDWLVWILLTLSLISAGIAMVSFNIIHQVKSVKAILKNTAAREIRKKAWFAGIIFSGICIFSSFWINNLCYYTSIIAVVLLFIIPLIKKIASIQPGNSGIFEAFCPVAGFIAVKNKFDILPFIIFASVVFWIAALNIAAALFEIQNNKTGNNFFTRRMSSEKAQAVSIVFFLIFYSLFITVGFMNARGLAYWISLMCVAIILIRQELLLKDKDPEIAGKEFLQINNFVGPLIAIGTVIDIFFQ